MARDMGVSHQKLGRWLSGTSEVPADYLTAKAVDLVFDNHVKRVKKWTAKQGLPYMGPVMPDRRPLNKLDDKGRQILGDRVVIHNSEFIRQEVRDAIVGQTHASRKFMGVTVRSVVDLYSYFKRADVSPDAGRRTDAQRESRYTLSTKFEDRGNYLGVSWQPKPTGANKELRSPIYTKITSMSPAVPSRVVTDTLNAKLRAKHEPATVKPGTVLADEILFQLYPEGFAPKSRRGRRGPKPRVKARGTRGTVRTNERKGRPPRNRKPV